MNYSSVAKRNDFSHISTVMKTLPESVRQEYRDEIKEIVKELHKLLPRYQLHVDLAWYRFSRDEVMRLTVYACDELLDIYTLESLLQQLEGHHQMFVTALAEVA